MHKCAVVTDRRLGTAPRGDCMKILYIAHERSAAQVADTALRRLAPNARMSWARDTGAALGWLRDNGDAAAVFADCGTENPEFEAFLGDVRSLGMTTPIAAVAPEHLQATVCRLQSQSRRPRLRGTGQGRSPRGAACRRSGNGAGRRNSGSEEQDAALASTHQDLHCRSRSASWTSRRPFTVPATVARRRRRQSNSSSGARRSCRRPSPRRSRSAPPSSEG